jgi:large subunit ribosomal protein L17
MRHNKAGRRLGRTTSHRIAMFRNMVTSFLNHERITTTDAKAKELRPLAEKMITLGKKGDLNSIRQAASYIRDKKVVTKLFTVLAPRFQERQGGYTRIIKLGTRLGDSAQLSIIELVEEDLKKKEVRKTKKKTPKILSETEKLSKTVSAGALEVSVQSEEGIEGQESTTLEEVEKTIS